MKEAVESWEEKSSDIGFDKGLVWSSIASKKAKKENRITWFRVAVAVILLFISWGWGNSYFLNNKLRQEKIVMVGNIQTLGQEMKIFSDEKRDKTVEIKVRVDTVIRVVTVEKKSDQLTIDYQNLLTQYQKLKLQHSEIENKLTASYNQYKVLEDSMSTLSINLQYYTNQQPYDLAFADKNIGLEVDEDALSALAEQKNELVHSASKSKKKIKLVFFNKSESPNSKAPAKRGISF